MNASLDPFFFFLFVTAAGLGGTVSVMFSPLAAVTCMWLAHRRGLNVRRYGLLGAVYAIFFLFPWIYLVTRLLGRTMSPAIAGAGYLVLYLGWIGLIIAIFDVARIEASQQNPEASPALYFVAACFGVIAAVGSAAALVLIDGRNSWEDSSSAYTLSPRELAPFALAFITVVVLILVSLLWRLD